jgi:hypothetical protein
MTKLTTRQRLFQDFQSANPELETFERATLYDFAEENGYTRGAATGLFNELERAERGIYRMQMVDPSNVVPMKETPKPPHAYTPEQAQGPEAEAPHVRSTLASEVYVPPKNPNFVRWGYFSDVKKIIQSKLFYPMFIAGLSGNGKTLMVEQACAASNREYVRVQITPETDEDDLIGGFRLVGGETVFAKGPVIKAMEQGALLLIDEIDRGSNKLMTLQGVLEGKPVLIKKTGEVVVPAPGFNVIATANTKGQGDETGRFIAATIIDDAFLERFVVTLEQPYPAQTTENKIVEKHMLSFGVEEAEAKAFSKLLVTWGQAIRKTYEEGGIDELISTRRLCHIAQTHSIFDDRKKSIELCVNRFEQDTKEAMVDLYEKMDADVGEENGQKDGRYDYENDDTPF